MTKGMDADKVHDFLTGRTDGVFLYSASGGTSYLFTSPEKIIMCKSPAEVENTLKLIDGYIERGYYAAGWMSFEAGFPLEKSLKQGAVNSGEPLVNFGIYKKAVKLKIGTLKLNEAYAVRFRADNRMYRKYVPGFNKIKRYIRDGEIYQVNYCMRVPFDLNGSAGAMFAGMCAAQRTSYSAFLRNGDTCVLSCSPEVFFEVNNRKITMKPMKGTMRAGKGARVKLFNCPKNRAENIMIVDLIRNDLSKISEQGSVGVPELFNIEKFGGLLQMTSTVTGRLRKGTGFSGIIKALFPSGSVTGAPKIRAMRMIAELEDEPRGIYTGAMGFAHRKRSVFNIPIRTAVLTGNSGYFGTGSGIVNDSDLDGEFRECMDKAGFFLRLENGLRIYETLLLTGGKFLFLGGHIKRLMRSTAAFGFEFDHEEFCRAAHAAARGRNKGEFRVRLSCGRDGKFKTEVSRLKKSSDRMIALSAKTTDSGNIFLYHKTTSRELYSSEYKKYGAKGFIDVIFCNSKGEVTEGSRANIFIKKGGVFYTPPVKCGLLPGVYRKYLLEKWPKKYREKVIKLKDLKNADEIYICNSLRGLWKVELGTGKV
jgi:para-aminobenzoate synthetase/4-amino-4-deoxychorismate lyase